MIRILTPEQFSSEDKSTLIEQLERLNARYSRIDNYNAYLFLVQMYFDNTINNLNNYRNMIGKLRVFKIEEKISDNTIEVLSKYGHTDGIVNMELTEGMYLILYRDTWSVTQTKPKDDIIMVTIVDNKLCEITPIRN